MVRYGRELDLGTGTSASPYSGDGDMTFLFGRQKEFLVRQVSRLPVLFAIVNVQRFASCVGRGLSSL